MRVARDQVHVPGEGLAELRVVSGVKPVPAAVVHHQPAVEPLATALTDADDRLKSRILKLLDRMGYKPKTKDEAAAVLPRLT